MGLYINGIGNTHNEKLDWLVENAEFAAVQEAGADKPKLDYEECAKEGKRFICAVDNGPFVAVGVAFDKPELERFMYPDGRDKAWFAVTLDKIKEMCPDWKDYMEEGA